MTVAALILALALAADGAPLLAPAPATPAPDAGSSLPESVREGAFESAALGQKVSFRVIVPKGYDQDQRKHPVLYLLHGYGGSYRNWTELTRIAQYAQPLDLVIVMPEGGNSWYWNAPGKPKAKGFDYLAKELPAAIEAQYRVETAPERRAIAGLSMGGLGSLAQAVKDPDRFAVVGSFSGALNATRDLGARRPEFRETLNAAFGPPLSASRKSADVFALTSKADPAKLPYLYLSCGADDPFLPINREYVALLQKRRIRYEAHELPGRHDWKFWDSQIQLFLALLEQRLELARR